MNRVGTNILSYVRTEKDPKLNEKCMLVFGDMYSGKSTFIQLCEYTFNRKSDALKNNSGKYSAPDIISESSMRPCTLVPRVSSILDVDVYEIPTTFIPEEKQPWETAIFLSYIKKYYRRFIFILLIPDTSTRMKTENWKKIVLAFVNIFEVNFLDRHLKNIYFLLTKTPDSEWDKYLNRTKKLAEDLGKSAKGTPSSKLIDYIVDNNQTLILPKFKDLDDDAAHIEKYKQRLFNWEIEESELLLADRIKEKQSDPLNIPLLKTFAKQLEDSSIFLLNQIKSLLSHYNLESLLKFRAQIQSRLMSLQEKMSIQPTNQKKEDLLKTPPMLSPSKKQNPLPSPSPTYLGFLLTFIHLRDLFNTPHLKPIFKIWAAILQQAGIASNQINYLDYIERALNLNQILPYLPKTLDSGLFALTNLTNINDIKETLFSGRARSGYLGLQDDLSEEYAQKMCQALKFVYGSEENLYSEERSSKQFLLYSYRAMKSLTPKEKGLELLRLYQTFKSKRKALALDIYGLLAKLMEENGKYLFASKFYKSGLQMSSAIKTFEEGLSRKEKIAIAQVNEHIEYVQKRGLIEQTLRIYYAALEHPDLTKENKKTLIDKLKKINKQADFIDSDLLKELEQPIPSYLSREDQDIIRQLAK